MTHYLNGPPPLENTLIPPKKRDGGHPKETVTKAAVNPLAKPERDGG